MEQLLYWLFGFVVGVGSTIAYSKWALLLSTPAPADPEKVTMVLMDASGTVLRSTRTAAGPLPKTIERSHGKHLARYDLMNTNGRVGVYKERL